MPECLWTVRLDSTTLTKTIADPDKKNNRQKYLKYLALALTCQYDSPFACTDHTPLVSVFYL